MSEDGKEESGKDLPSPRFNLVSRMFDEIDGILAKYDETEHLSIFEFEILVLMIRKKIEHLGIMTALVTNDEEPNNTSGNSNVYQ